MRNGGRFIMGRARAVGTATALQSSFAHKVLADVLSLICTAKTICRLRKVGWIFTQSSAERDYIMDSQEIQQMAAMQVAKPFCYDGCAG